MFAIPDRTEAAEYYFSDNPFTVRALVYLAVGHVTHHIRILRERYLAASASPGRLID